MKSLCIQPQNFSETSLYIHFLGQFLCGLLHHCIIVFTTNEAAFPVSPHNASGSQQGFGKGEVSVKIVCKH